MADAQPSLSISNQIAVNADRIDERDNRGIFDDTNPAPLKVIDLKAE